MTALLGGLGPQDEVALVVTEATLPDDAVLAAMHRWRTLARTAERAARRGVPRRHHRAALRLGLPRTDRPPVDRRRGAGRGRTLGGDLRLLPPERHARGARHAAAPGGERLGWIAVRDVESGAVERREVGGLFLLQGAAPHCDWLPPEVAMDPRGFVLTGRGVPTAHQLDGLTPAALATTLPGVSAAGDARSGSTKRVASASGEGASVVPLVHAHLADAALA